MISEAKGRERMEWEEVQKLVAVIAAGTLFDSLEKAK